eukprot:9084091-Ditylum_brightwellii.AAC.1
MKALKTVFEGGDFDLNHKKDVDFHAFTVNALNPENNDDKKKVKMLWVNYQMCDKFHTEWSTVAQTIKVKKKVSQQGQATPQAWSLDL